MTDWNELCFVLNKSLASNISEQLFELKVIQAMEKLGWSQYKGELSIRESIQIGSVNRIHPDITIKSSDGQNQFVVEIKRPSEDLTAERFRNQLHSYMRMTRVNLGLLIGNKIQVFVDGSFLNSQEPILIEEISFIEDNIKGNKFIELFSKDNFSLEKIKLFIDDKLDREKKSQIKKGIVNKLLNIDQDHLKAYIISAFEKDFDTNLIEEVLQSFILKIERKEELVDETNITPNLKGNESRNFRYIPAKDSYSSKRSIIKNTDNKRTVNGMKIGEFVQESFRDLFMNNALTNDELMKLQEESYCKLHLNQGRKVLRKLNEGTTDHMGYDRYYTKEIFGGQYYLTSQWYEGQWDPFLKWLASIKKIR